MKNKLSGLGTAGKIGLGIGIFVGLLSMAGCALGGICAGTMIDTNRASEPEPVEEVSEPEVVQ